MDAALSIWAAIVPLQSYDRNCFTECARTWAVHLSTPSQREFTATTGCQSSDNSLDFNAIYCTLLWNNSIYIIRRNYRVEKVFMVLIKCMGLRPSVTLSSRWHGWRTMRAGVNNSLLNSVIHYFKHHHCCFNLYVCTGLKEYFVVMRYCQAHIPREAWLIMIVLFDAAKFMLECCGLCRPGYMFHRSFCVLIFRPCINDKKSSWGILYPISITDMCWATDQTIKGSNIEGSKHPKVKTSKPWRHNKQMKVILAMTILTWV